MFVSAECSTLRCVFRNGTRLKPILGIFIEKAIKNNTLILSQQIFTKNDDEVPVFNIHQEQMPVLNFHQVITQAEEIYIFRPNQP